MQLGQARLSSQYGAASHQKLYAEGFSDKALYLSVLMKKVQLSVDVFVKYVGAFH